MWALGSHGVPGTRCSATLASSASASRSSSWGRGPATRPAAPRSGEALGAGPSDRPLSGAAPALAREAHDEQVVLCAAWSRRRPRDREAIPEARDRCGPEGPCMAVEPVRAERVRAAPDRPGPPQLQHEEPREWCLVLRRRLLRRADGDDAILHVHGTGKLGPDHRRGREAHPWDRSHPAKEEISWQVHHWQSFDMTFSLPDQRRRSSPQARRSRARSTPVFQAKTCGGHTRGFVCVAVSAACVMGRPLC